MKTKSLKSDASPTGRSYNGTLGAVCDDPQPWPVMLRDECLVRLEKPEQMTASKRLWIPDSAKRQEYELYQGYVLAVGPGRMRKDGRVNPNEVQIGDRVMFYWAAGECDPVVRWTEDNQELRVIAEWQTMMRWPGHLSMREAFA